MVRPLATSTKNPSKSTVGRCLLFTKEASIKLWKAPPSISTVTLCPWRTPLILKVMNFGTPLMDAITNFLILAWFHIDSSSSSPCVGPILFGSLLFFEYAPHHLPPHYRKGIQCSGSFLSPCISALVPMVLYNYSIIVFFSTPFW